MDFAPGSNLKIIGVEFVVKSENLYYMYSPFLSYSISFPD
jgi:hypothetical protein